MRNNSGGGLTEMNAHDAAEVAYRNGYEAGVKDLYNAIIESNNEEYLKLVAKLLEKNK